MIQTHISCQTLSSNGTKHETTSQEDQQISPPTPVVRPVQFCVRKKQPNHWLDLKDKRETSLQTKTFSPDLSKCLYLHTRIRIFWVSPESNNNIPKNRPRNTNTTNYHQWKFYRNFCVPQQECDCHFYFLFDNFSVVYLTYNKVHISQHTIW